MPIGQEHLYELGATQEPGAVPGTTQVTLSNGDVVQVANQALEGPSELTAQDVAGQVSPAEEVAAALGYEQGALEGAEAALMASDEAVQQEFEAAQQADVLGTYAQVGDLSSYNQAIADASTRGTQADPSSSQNVYVDSGITVDELQEDLDALRAYDAGGVLPATATEEVAVRQGPGGEMLQEGPLLEQEPRRRGRSPVSSETVLTQSYDVVDVDPELEANARRLEDELRSTLAAVHLREAEFRGELAGLESTVADDLLQDREEISAIARQAAMEQRRGLETLNSLNQSVMSRSINPERFFSSRGGSARFSAAASVALGTLAQSLSPGMQNSALSIIDNAIERDIEAQVVNLRNANLGIDRQRGLLSDLRTTFGDELQARQALRSMYLTEAQRRISALTAQASSDKEVLAGQTLIQDLLAQRARNDADLAARAGTVSVNRTVRVRGAANSQRVQRQIAAMATQSPAQRAAINYRRVMQGLPPLEAPAAPQRPTRAGGSGDNRTAVERDVPPTQTQAVEPSAGRRPITEIRRIDDRLYRQGSGENAVEYEMVRAPVIRGGLYEVRDAQGRTRYIGANETIPEGFRQQTEIRHRQLFRRTAEEVQANVAAVTPIPVGGNRSIPSMTQNQRLAAAWASFREQNGEEAAARSLDAVNTAQGAILALQALQRAYDRHGYGNLRDPVATSINRLFVNLNNFQEGSVALGIIGDNERPMFAVLDPHANMSAERKQQTLQALFNRYRRNMRNQPAYRYSLPNNQIGPRPPSSARPTQGRR